DEATSALDIESEETIREALARLMHGRTVIAIAHRLSTLRHFDRIIVLRDGQIDQDGPPDKLILRDGPYRELVMQEMSRLVKQAAHWRGEPVMRLLAGLLVLMLSAGPVVAAPQPEDEVERIVTRHVKALLPDDGIGGAAVALRLEGRTLFFNYRWADAAAERPVTSDSLFNLGSLRKGFEATLLALAVESGRLALDARGVDCLPELPPERAIGRITIGQLATHTSGLLLPQDHPPWPTWGYTLPSFIHAMNDWTADIDHQPGGQHIYTHAGFILLALALERRLGQPIDE